MKLIKVITITGMMVFMASCVTRGTDFRSSTDWIRSGATTQGEVRQLMGQPFSVGKTQDGETWTYGYYKHQLFGDSLVKELKFYWNHDGTVRSFSFSSSFPDDKGVKAVDRNAVPGARSSRNTVPGARTSRR